MTTLSNSQLKNLMKTEIETKTHYLMGFPTHAERFLDSRSIEHEDL